MPERSPIAPGPGRRPDQRDEIADRARRIHMARLRKNWRGECPDLTPEELDEVLPPVACRRTGDRRKKGDRHAQ